MKKEWCLLIFLCITALVPAACAAGEIVITDAVDLWTGSWRTEVNATVDITQTGSEMTGIYTPAEGITLLSSTLEGTVSGDGKEVSGFWTDIGPITMNLSDDRQSADVLWGYNEFETYTRNGTGGIPGVWQSATYILTLAGDGTRLSGTIVPTDTNETEVAQVNGTVSDDGNRFEGTWTETGKFLFTIGDDHDRYTGVYGYDESDLVQTWNGTRNI